MGFKLGLATGFGAGYYLGSKAGRERYRQLQDLLRKAKESDAVGTAAEKARAAVDMAKGKVEEVRGDGGGAAAGPADDTDVDDLRPDTPLGSDGVNVPTPEI